ncbi:hypothetical protein HSZ48_05510 [Staphylococcus saprophyticus]|uniref:hypothetical protein n=1 Tax=Staphylococcus saprophyticus TaxID=29385 RepID=UPI001584B88B|nr:hypothetical protein [Staphylococcus saprophyticus]MCM3118972.1 hypothetical protein [Staphylococcus saprophyticus]QKV11130.1 hypothetical protein HSZ48_05510 [Staphylococcus saprophyticus]
MVKIKQKKQLNLPQLIEWAWENNVKNERYRCSDSNPYEYVWINENSDVELDEDMSISKNDTFTVEAEEVVDEDTVFEEILLIVNNGLGIEVYSNYSINDVLSNNEGYYEETVMLILKPDPEVIWTREKGLVE